MYWRKPSVNLLLQNDIRNMAADIFVDTISYQKRFSSWFSALINDMNIMEARQDYYCITRNQNVFVLDY